MQRKIFKLRVRLTSAITALAGTVSFSVALAGQPSTDAESQARAAWRDSIEQLAVPGDGCFYAAYPNSVWIQVACSNAPNRPFVPRLGATAHTVGNGNDYAASVAGLLSKSVGTFPSVTGVTSETGLGQANVYSIQLNSNFMVTAACNGIPNCLSWEQFVYSSSEQSAFMQYWLIDFGNRCPRGWNSFSGSCFRNSRAVAVPQVPISELANLKLSGSAVLNGRDTLVFTTATEAFSTTGKDSVVDLATAWNESEFNIIGDGGGSSAKFNAGSSLTVRIATTDGTRNAPACASNAGTTGETNNLTLGSCTGSGGLKPGITFTESN